MTVRVGLVGAGSMAQYHIAGCRNAGAAITAVTDRNEESGRPLAQKLNARFFPDLTAMLASGLVDAVIILTPNRAPVFVETV